jgi:Protein of unknown function (DUF732)
MRRKRTATGVICAVAVAAALVAAGLAVSSPAQAWADPQGTVTDSPADGGIDVIDPATAAATVTELGQQVCPMLVDPGQQLADVAAGVAEAVGKPLPPATMFTGLAISVFCPGAVASLVNGQSDIPLALLGSATNAWRG